MRDIKFRAWDKTRNNFTWGNSNLILTLGGLKMWQFAMNAPEPVNQDDFILMQFTGLKDKDGKEIYEGDIVRYANSMESGTGVIEPFFETANLHCRWYKQKTSSPSIFTSIDYLGCPQELEVIGNIYENGDLIK